MVCVTKAMIQMKDFAHFSQVQSLSKQDVATMVETMTELLKTNSASDIQDVYKDKDGHILFVLSDGRATKFDFFAYVNSMCKDSVVLDAVNIKSYAPANLSHGLYTEQIHEKYKDSFEEYETATGYMEQATGFMDEDEILDAMNKGFSVYCVRLGREIRVTDDVVTVGRSKVESDFSVDNTNVSRVHLVFYVEDGKFYVRDKNSKNGTFVNGRKLKKDGVQQITSGDKVYAADEEFVIK